MTVYDQPTPCPLPWAGPSVSYPQQPQPRIEDSTFSSRQFASSRNSFYDNNDDTANLDFTTEVRASIRAAAPRRRPRKTIKAFEPSLEICEDAVELSTAGPSHQPAAAQHRAVIPAARPRRTSILPATAIAEEGSHAPRRSSMMLAQPAHRLPPSGMAGTRAPARRRVSTLVADRALASEPAPSEVQSAPPPTDMVANVSRPAREPRRRTIFIPSDDTTIMTIHPGGSEGWQAEETARTRGIGPRSRALVEVPEEEFHESGEERRELPVAQPRRVPRPSLGGAPRRALPLQHTGRAVQSTTKYKNLPGQGGGKENLPPGWDKNSKGKSNKVSEKGLKSRISIIIDDKPKSRKPAGNGIIVKSNTTATVARSTHNAAVARGTGRATVTRTTNTATVTRKPQPSTNTVSHKRTNSDTAVRQDRPKLLKAGAAGLDQPKPALAGTSVAPATKPKPSHAVKSNDVPLAGPPAKLAVPTIAITRPTSDLQQYPFLEDDLRHPQMYEDDWLSHQEKAIMHLINALFEAADAKTHQGPVSDQELRKSLLDTYQTSPFPLLHTRLQASLLYGALSIPKDLLATSGRLQDDIGLRKSFLSMWLETYQPTVLKAAAEVIIGRTIPIARASSASASGTDAHSRRELRSISTFLETFLVRNDDAVRVKHGVGSIASIARTATSSAANLDNQLGWSLRRTLLRSLMLILLLDHAKTQALTTTPLFLSTSPHKSSAAVLHRIAQLLHPSLGDITRVLSHLSYSPAHVEAPLAEFPYPLTNLATDLRDGVRLTRLVELLLYPPPTLMPHHKRDEEITLTLPTGELLTSSASVEAQPLSKHLKYPCISRATKVFNTQVALSALPGSVSRTVKADDIVNGHRERTIALLWSLVSTWGLSTLVPLDQLKQEINRLAILPGLSSRWDVPSERDESPAKLLQRWAATVAAPHGLKVTNLSTSFADGRVFHAIVDAYVPHFPSPTSAASASTAPSLETKLQQTIGCSKHFASLFSAHTLHQSPTRETTLPLLALLASRLLPTARAARAAGIIQRTWRKRMARVMERRRAVLAALASDCAMVVQTRNRVVGAAVVIQVAWRKWLRARGRFY